VEEMIRYDSPLLVEAMVAWLGVGRNSWPEEHDAVVLEKYGAQVASTLLPALKALKQEFFASKAYLVAPNLLEMASMAEDDFRRAHPGIPEEIVAALSWCYSFNYR
jgi:hypothetical protein